MQNGPTNLGALSVGGFIYTYAVPGDARVKLEAANIGQNAKPTIFITLPGPGAPIPPEQIDTWKARNLAGCTGVLAYLMEKLTALKAMGFSVVVLTSMTEAEFDVAESRRTAAGNEDFPATGTDGITFIHDPELAIAKALRIDTVTACGRKVYPSMAGILNKAGKLEAVIEGHEQQAAPSSLEKTEKRKAANVFVDETIMAAERHEDELNVHVDKKPKI